jgi:hypothetical protein
MYIIREEDYKHDLIANGCDYCCNKDKCADYSLHELCTEYRNETERERALRYARNRAERLNAIGEFCFVYED